MHATCSFYSNSLSAAESEQMDFRGLGRTAGIVDRGEQLDVLLAAVAQAAAIGIFVSCSSTGEIRQFHRGSAPLAAFGLDAEQVEPGVVWFDNIYPGDRDQVREYWSRGKKAYEPIEYRLIDGQGELRWVRHWVLHWIRLPREDWAYHAIQPITEQKYLEWECLQISEREAVRIGQELHDEGCQVLFGIACLLRGLSVRTRQRDQTLAAEIDELTAQAAGAADRLRTLSHTLFRTKSNRGAIAEALQQVTVDAAKLFKIDVRFECAAIPPHHTEEQVIQLCRIAQEAIANAARHGRATKVIVQLSGTGGDGMRLLIEDNGSGMPAEAARAEGIGLNVMHYRMHSMGGTLELRPASPHGVIVDVNYLISSQPPLL